MHNCFHPEEKYQVWKVVHYHYRHPQTLLDIRFFSGEEYRGIFDAAYDSENGRGLDIEVDSPRYNKFSQIVFETTEIIKDGPRRYNEFLAVDYRDFLVLITNMETGEIVYSAETDPLRR